MIREKDLRRRVENLFVFPDCGVARILKGSWNLCLLCPFKWGWRSRNQSGGGFWVWNVKVSRDQYSCQLGPGYLFSKTGFFFPKIWVLMFSNRESWCLLDAPSAVCYSQEQSWGCGRRACRSLSCSPKLWHLLLPPDLGMRKEIIKQESMVVSFSFKAADLVSSLGCRPPGPAELGQTVCKLICPLSMAWRS